MSGTIPPIIKFIAIWVYSFCKVVLILQTNYPPAVVFNCEQSLESNLYLDFFLLFIKQTAQKSNSSQHKFDADIWRTNDRPHRDPPDPSSIFVTMSTTQFNAGCFTQDYQNMQACVKQKISDEPVPLGLSRANKRQILCGLKFDQMTIFLIHRHSMVESFRSPTITENRADKEVQLVRAVSVRCLPCQVHCTPPTNVTNGRIRTNNQKDAPWKAAVPQRQFCRLVTSRVCEGETATFSCARAWLGVPAPSPRPTVTVENLIELREFAPL